MDAVMVILPIRPQTFLDLLQEPAVPPTLFCPMESAVIPLLIDAQRPKHGHHWPTAQVGVDEAVLPAGVYGLRRLAKKNQRLLENLHVQPGLLELRPQIRDLRPPTTASTAADRSFSRRCHVYIDSEP